MSNDPAQIENARRVLPGLKSDAALLTQEWPTRPGRLPFSGQYSIETDDTGFFAVVGNTKSSDLGQWCGPFIWKVASGGVRFDIDTVGVKLEYHPAGSVPTSFITVVRYTGGKGRVEHLLERFVELEPNWFVAWYSVRDL